MRNPADAPRRPSLIRGSDSTILQDHEGATLVDLLRSSAERYPSAGISIYDRKGIEAETRAYPDLMERITLAASRLARRGVVPGDRVLVCLPTSWELLDYWLGCVHLGALPAVVAPPIGTLGPSSDLHHRLDRFRSVVDARLLIGTDNLIERLRDHSDAVVASISASASELSALDADGGGGAHRADSGDVAFLQFTSGSTGLPRAVMISHRTFVHNVFSLDVMCAGPYGDRSEEWSECLLSWLPLSHDMGLIGSFYGMATGMDVVLLSPGTFLSRPHKWLQAGSGRRFISPAPNFGYQFCVERMKDAYLEGIDLSQPKRFCIGSEMIRADTMDAFLRKLGGTGLKPEHFLPCYGMAESTVGLSFDTTGRGIRVSTPDPPEGKSAGEPVVCCGTPIPDTEIRIVDASDGRTILPEGTQGAIQAKGPSVFSGYYGDEEATRTSFVDGWLQTGDLGFIRDGELYVTGRAKDVLIIRGENIMPQDLEWQVEEVRGGGGVERSAAFSVTRGPAGEEPVLVVETTVTDTLELARLEEAIRSRIGRVLGLVVADMVFVRRGRIPKTTSGKIKRVTLREEYLAGDLERLDHADQEIGN